MTDPQGTSIDTLVAEVNQAPNGEDPLSRLDTAVVLGSALVARADQLLDHFVGQARDAGHSWTEIGIRLGISKQAAREQFAGRTQALAFNPVLRPRLRACLTEAEREAQADGSVEVGTHHLLAGLLAEGVAAAILERLGVTGEAIRQASHRLFGPPAPARDVVPAMSAEAVCALEAAAHNAANQATATACPEVGTEHLLAVLALDPGSRARRVLNELGTDIEGIKRELSCHLSLNPRPRRRRWWQHRPQTTTCSFCGKPRALVGELVTGKGAYICANCVRIASEVLARTPATPSTAGTAARSGS